MEDTFVDSAGTVVGSVEVLRDTKVEPRVANLIESRITILDGNHKCILIDEGRYTTGGPHIGIPVDRWLDTRDMRRQIVHAVQLIVQQAIDEDRQNRGA